MSKLDKLRANSQKEKSIEESKLIYKVDEITENVQTTEQPTSVNKLPNNINTPSLNSIPIIDTNTNISLPIKDKPKKKKQAPAEPVPESYKAAMYRLKAENVKYIAYKASLHDVNLKTEFYNIIKKEMENEEKHPSIISFADISDQYYRHSENTKNYNISIPEYMIRFIKEQAKKRVQPASNYIDDILDNCRKKDGLI